MRVRTFRVGFEQVAPDATELEFGPDDYLVVRPLFALSGAAYLEFSERLKAIEDKPPEEHRVFVAWVLEQTVQEWHLTDYDGQAILQPKTPDELMALPAGLNPNTLFAFLLGFRGDGANPTTAV